MPTDDTESARQSSLRRKCLSLITRQLCALFVTKQLLAAAYDQHRFVAKPARNEPSIVRHDILQQVGRVESNSV